MASKLWWWVGGWLDLVRTRPRPKEKIDRTDLPPNPSTTPLCEPTDPARLGSGSSGLYIGTPDSGLGMPKKCLAVQQAQQSAEEWPHCNQANLMRNLSLQPPQEQGEDLERRRQKVGLEEVGGLQSMQLVLEIAIVVLLRVHLAEVWPERPPHSAGAGIALWPAQVQKRLAP